MEPHSREASYQWRRVRYAKEASYPGGELPMDLPGRRVTLGKDDKELCVRHAHSGDLPFLARSEPAPPSLSLAPVVGDPMEASPTSAHVT